MVLGGDGRNVEFVRSFLFFFSIKFDSVFFSVVSS